MPRDRVIDAHEEDLAPPPYLRAEPVTGAKAGGSERSDRNGDLVLRADLRPTTYRRSRYLIDHE